MLFKCACGKGFDTPPLDAKCPHCGGQDFDIADERARQAWMIMTMVYYAPHRPVEAPRG